jgi:hypothetical protein
MRVSAAPFSSVRMLRQRPCARISATSRSTRARQLDAAPAQRAEIRSAARGS